MRPRRHARDHGRRVRDGARVHLPPGVLHKAPASGEVALQQGQGTCGRVCRLRCRGHGAQSSALLGQSMDYGGVPLKSVRNIISAVWILAVDLYYTLAKGLWLLIVIGAYATLRYDAQCDSVVSRSGQDTS